MPTTVFDKAAIYLLQHPELIVDAVANYQELSNLIKADVFYDAPYTLMAALRDDPAFEQEARVRNRDLALSAIARHRLTPDSGIQQIMSRTFDAFLRLGDVLRHEAYSAEELDHTISGKTLAG